MASIFLSEADAAGKDVIFVDGACYFKGGTLTGEATFSGDAPDFADCPECCAVIGTSGFPEAGGSAAPSFAACGTPNANPTVFITMSWTDEDATKDLLNCTYTNGETKEMYAITYTNTSSIQHWRRSTGGDAMNMYDGPNTVGPPGSFVEVIQFQRSVTFTLNAFKYSYTPATATTTNVGTTSVASHNIDPNNFVINGALNTFGQLTTTTGITITWEQGNGW